MGFASCYEDNLDARGESVRRRHRRLTPPNVTRTLQPKQLLKPLQQKTTHNIRQDICRRELQKTQRAQVQKTPHVPVMKTRYVTTEEIERRIQREIIRQSILKE